VKVSISLSNSVINCFSWAWRNHTLKIGPFEPVFFRSRLCIFSLHTRDTEVPSKIMICKEAIKVHHYILKLSTSRSKMLSSSSILLNHNYKYTIKTFFFFYPLNNIGTIYFIIEYWHESLCIFIQSEKAFTSISCKIQSCHSIIIILIIT